MSSATPESALGAAPVRTVPNPSPLRYPGGKTWLTPHLRAWLNEGRGGTLIEAFAGGASAALTALVEELVERVVLIERDADVAAFWREATRAGDTLAARYETFEPEEHAVRAVWESEAHNDAERAWRTLVRNRTARGGIIAGTARALNRGENGRGVRSRWYAGTIAGRLRAVKALGERIECVEGDALEILARRGRGGTARVRVFADPPYEGAGKRLYTHGEVNHDRLFALLAGGRADFLMTCEDNEATRRRTERHRLHAVRVRMRNTHHRVKTEVVIGRAKRFAGG